MGLTVADKRVVTILGVVPVFITTRRAISKEGFHTRQLLYIVKELQGTFISRDALQDLGLLVSISHRFHRRLGKPRLPRSLQWNMRLGLQRIVTWV